MSVGKDMKSTDNKEPLLFSYFVQLLATGMAKIHIVIQKITLSIHIVECMICIYMKNNVL